MKPLFEQCGYGVQKPGNLAEIDSQARRCDVVVIYLALIFDMEVSADASVLYLAKDDLTNPETRERAR